MHFKYSSDCLKCSRIKLLKDGLPTLSLTEMTSMFVKLFTKVRISPVVSKIIDKRRISPHK